MPFEHTSQIYIFTNNLLVVEVDLANFEWGHAC